MRVTETDNNIKLGYSFLFAFCSNDAILHGLREIATYWSKSRNIYTQAVFNAAPYRW